MEIRVKNCCHSTDSRPRFRAKGGDRVLVRMVNQTVRLAETIAIIADDHLEIKFDDSPQEIGVINSVDILSLYLDD